MSGDRLPHACYGMLKGLDDCNRVTWASNIKMLLDHVNLVLNMFGTHRVYKMKIRFCVSLRIGLNNIL